MCRVLKNDMLIKRVLKSVKNDMLIKRVVKSVKK